MPDYRLKIKIGEHEFEAEGPTEAVQSQFQAFKELVASAPAHKPENKELPESDANKPENAVTVPLGSQVLGRIFRQDRRVISLTAPPTSENDAVLLVLYGQRFYRENDNATGSEIIDGMEQSGYRTPRIDRILGSLASEGSVIITGAHRGKKYRLTNQGNTRAEGLARSILANLP